MNDNTTDLDLADEEALTSEISDDALEASAGAPSLDGMRSGLAWTNNYTCC